ncbi:MAG: adenylate kinase [Elusimicrobia bacterium]|nr:adenylate kinase [Elusimicrobiota bacterium]
MNLVLMGPPGSGKGTQCSRLAAELGIAHISTGDILRQAVKGNTPLGKEASVYIQAGKLVPDETMIRIVEERVQQKDCEKGFLLDGFPRTIPQAEMLDATGPQIDCVIALLVDAEECVRRVANRKTCSQCGLTYNPVTHPPRKNGKCDVCGSDLILRVDDQPETMRERLKVYSQMTEPLVRYYQKSERLAVADGMSQPENILKNLKNLIYSRLPVRGS